MKGKLVQYGAGNIGRGFIGQIFSQAGYEVCFIDIDEKTITALNRNGEYPVNILSNDKSEEVWVKNVRGVMGIDIDAVSAEIATADYMAISVGVSSLPKIVPMLSAGLKKRWNIGNLKPLSILICENMIDSDKYLRELLYNTFDDREKLLFKDLIGLVETSIGRMVPIMTDKMRKGNILRVCVESYCELPIDSDSFVGELPLVPQIKPYSPFSYYIRRKLFIHNMGHTMVAYLGNLCNYKYIWQAAENPAVRKIAEKAMGESALCLSKCYGIDFSEIKEHIDDLLLRFDNKALGDTVQRVGRDIGRKLSPNDRFCGALSFCNEIGVKPTFIPIGIAAAMFFRDDSEGTNYFLNLIDINGFEDVLRGYCQIDDYYISLVKKYYSLIRNSRNSEALEALIDKADLYSKIGLQTTS